MPQTDERCSGRTKLWAGKKNNGKEMSKVKIKIKIMGFKEEWEILSGKWRK